MVLSLMDEPALGRSHPEERQQTIQTLPAQQYYRLHQTGNRGIRMKHRTISLRALHTIKLGQVITLVKVDHRTATVVMLHRLYLDPISSVGI